MISAILVGLALHLTYSYSFGAKPYGLIFIVSAILLGLATNLTHLYSLGATPYRLISREDLSNTVGFGATPYRLVFVSQDDLMR